MSSHILPIPRPGYDPPKPRTLNALGCFVAAAVLIFAASTSLLVSAPPPISHSDAQLRKAIVGTWETSVSANKFPLRKAFRTFYRDGGFQTLLVFSTETAEGTVEFRGTWRIQDGILIQRETRSAYPKLFGTETKVKIVSIDDTRWVEQNDKGRVEMRRAYLPNIPSAQKWALDMKRVGDQIKAFGLETPPLKYPEEARVAHITGHGFFKVNIDRNGHVASVEPLQSTGSSILDRAAIDTLERWRFKPGTMKEFTMPVHFTIRDEKVRRRTQQTANSSASRRS